MGKGFGKKDEYILFQPMHDDYLAIYEDSEYVRQMGWSSHPSKAIKFASEELARKTARKILEDKEPDYQLVICQLYDVGDRLAVKQIKQLSNS